MSLKKLSKSIGLFFLLIAAASSFAGTSSINGAGSTFIYPVLSQWAQSYEKATGVAVNYQSIGSGGGIKLIKSGTVTFGASDAPLSIKALDQAGLIQWPMVVGGIVPVVNIPGVKTGMIKLDGTLLADIYQGKVAKWNDARIAKLNPGLKLPDMPIYPVHRAEGSGTTYNFTAYLSKVSQSWATTVGTGKMVAWPKDNNGLAGKGNAGVANLVKRVPGAIGYVEYAYAAQSQLMMAEMQNKAGKFVKPNLMSFQAAAANANWAKAPGMQLILVNQPGAKSWPITASTFILMHKRVKDPAANLKALKFFEWAYTQEGANMAKKLDYVPMPTNVVTLIQSNWASQMHVKQQAITGK